MNNLTYNPLTTAWKAWRDLLTRERRWGNLLERAGLKINSRDESAFEASLAGEISVNRKLPGFEDFAQKGKRGIEPGQPFLSLLYHALASPSVTELAGRRLGAFPTLEEIDAVENYIYGGRPPSITELQRRARGAPLAIAVFAYEYRPAAQTSHKKHADMCFSRTGLARVGTAANEYGEEIRGFLPWLPGDKNEKIRVLPCRYAAFIAAQLPGDPNNFGPMRFRPGKGKRSKSDRNRLFWVPLHKLFSGESIAGRQVSVEFEVNHVNEKLRRFHMVLQGQGYDSGHSAKAIDHPPFRFEDGIATVQPIGESKSGILVMPCDHKSVVEPVEVQHEGKTSDLTFNMPLIPYTLRTTLWMEPPDLINRACPEFIYSAASRVSGQSVDLSLRSDFVAKVRAGGYNAVHYRDFTGDGYVKARCPELEDDFPQSLSAYSIIGPPDFFPLVTQRDLADWFDALPPDLKSLIWTKTGINPEPLSDARLAANVEIEEAGFLPHDQTITAVVSGLHGAAGRRMKSAAPVVRASYLPDHAAGLFAPGWDTSRDKSKKVNHLSAYGLGSPFPEDMKLCAAESAFWPAATPDTTRFYPPLSGRSTTPLPDRYAGWDQVALPRQDPKQPDIWEYASLGQVNYVRTAYDNKFQFGSMAPVTFEQYIEWTLVMARAHIALKATTQSAATPWYVPRFELVTQGDAEFRAAQKQTGVSMDPAHTYRLEMFKGEQTNRAPEGDATRIQVQATQPALLYANTKTVLTRGKNGQWEKTRFKKLK